MLKDKNTLEELIEPIDELITMIDKLNKEGITFANEIPNEDNKAAIALSTAIKHSYYDFDEVGFFAVQKLIELYENKEINKDELITGMIYGNEQVLDESKLLAVQFKKSLQIKPIINELKDRICTNNHNNIYNTVDLDDIDDLETKLLIKKLKNIMLPDVYCVSSHNQFKHLILQYLNGELKGLGNLVAELMNVEKKYRRINKPYKINSVILEKFNSRDNSIFVN